MALARSASGPAGLNINTSSANSIFGSGSTPAPASMFGSTQASKPLFGASITAPQSGGLSGAATSQPAGGLFGSPATTSQPQTGGLFGSASTQTSTGGLFGAAAASQPQTGGLFGSTATSSQPPSGGLFGPTGGGLFGKPGTSQPASSGGLFGQSAAASQSQQSGGLFGQSTTASQPQQSGGLFGQSAAASQPQQSGGLFGQSAAASQPQQSGGLFGQSTAVSQAQQSGGLFGGPGQTQNQTTGGGLFGASSANQGSSLFGSTQNQNKPAASSLFGSMGAAQSQQPQPQPQQPSITQPLAGGFLPVNQQQQLAPGVRVDMTNIKGSTRVQELHEDLQKQLAHIDSLILAQEERMTQTQAFMPPHGDKIAIVPSDVEYCTRKMRALADLTDGDVEAVSSLKLLIEEDAEQAKLSFRAIDNLKLPPQYHNSGWSTKGSSDKRSQGTTAIDSQDIVGYFSATADEMSSKLAKHQKNISEIETHLRSVEGSTAQQIQAFVARREGGRAAQSDDLRELAESFQDFERGILNVAGKVGSAREKVQGLQLGGFMGNNGGAAKTKRPNGIY